MLETPHALMGAAIATKVDNPLLAIGLSFGSHFLLDKVPHWNPHLNTEISKFKKVSTGTTIFITIDSLLALVTVLFIAIFQSQNFTQFSLIILCAFFALLPDLVEAPYYFLGQTGKLIEKWIKFQKSIQANADIIPGSLTQISLIIILLLWIFKF